MSDIERSQRSPTRVDSCLPRGSRGLSEICPKPSKSSRWCSQDMGNRSPSRATALLRADRFDHSVLDDRKRARTSEILLARLLARRRAGPHRLLAGWDAGEKEIAGCGTTCFQDDLRSRREPPRSLPGVDFMTSARLCSLSEICPRQESTAGALVRARQLSDAQGPSWDIAGRPRLVRHSGRRTDRSAIYKLRSGSAHGSRRQVALCYSVGASSGSESPGLPVLTGSTDSMRGDGGTRSAFEISKL